jgi:hypothetical protein
MRIYQFNGGGLLDKLIIPQLKMIFAFCGTPRAHCHVQMVKEIPVSTLPGQ